MSYVNKRQYFDKRFRAWDKFQKKYVFTGFHVMGEVTCFGMIDQIISETYEERMKVMGHSGSLFAWNDFILEQFTGMFDTTTWDELSEEERKYLKEDEWKGKEIYEGDIAEYSKKAELCVAEGCGEKIEYGKNYCSRCGTKVDPSYFKTVAIVTFTKGGFAYSHFQPEDYERYQNDPSQLSFYTWQFSIAESFLRKVKVIGNIHENPDLVPELLLKWYNYEEIS